MNFSMTKKYGVFTPTQDQDYDEFSKLKDGDYIVKIKKVRSPVRHREFFGILNLVFENLPENVDCRDRKELLYFLKAEMMLEAYKRGLDECPAGRMNKKGKVILKSISFEDMTQDEFDNWTRDAYKLLAKWMGMEVADLGEWYRNQ